MEGREIEKKRMVEESDSKGVEKDRQGDERDGVGTEEQQEQEPEERGKCETM
jgi:hypothetical protein